MSRATRTSAIASWIWAGLIFAVGAVVIVGVLAQNIVDSEAVILMMASVGYTGVGLLIAVKRPGNRIAWLFLTVATWIVLSGTFTAFVSEYDGPPSPVRTLDLFNIMFGNVGYFIMLLIPLLLLFYLFPDGRFLNRRWSLAGWVALTISIVAGFSQVAATEVGPTDGSNWSVPNPIGFLEGSGLDGQGVFSVIFAIGFIPLGLLAVPALIVRYRRSDAAVRSQIKWVVYAAVIVGGTSIIAVFLGEAAPEWFSDLWFYALVTVFPITIAVAITRSRLYEIDRIVSRTVAYILVVGLLALVYLVGAVWLPSRLYGEQPPLFVAATTLAIAALFNPLRRTVLNAVDRRFNRARYDSQRVLEDFTTDLGNATDVDQLAQDSLDLVSRTMQPVAAGIWIRSDD